MNNKYADFVRKVSYIMLKEPELRRLSATLLETAEYISELAAENFRYRECLQKVAEGPCTVNPQYLARQSLRNKALDDLSEHDQELGLQ